MRGNNAFFVFKDEKVMRNKLTLASTLLPLVIISGCGSESGGYTPPPNIGEPGSDPSAPNSYVKYQNVLSQSSLQVSDPFGEPGNKETLVKNGQFADFYNDHFYYDQSVETLTFAMSGYSNRSEVRVDENFDTSEVGVQRVLNASILPIGVESSLANSPADKDTITYLQIHNKGTDESGTGYIPHPLLRIVYEQERDGLIGHYWAVLKTNAVDCSDPVKSETDDCKYAYERIDLGKADLDRATDFKLEVREGKLSIDKDNIREVERDITYWSHLLSYFKFGLYNQFENGEAKVQFPSVSMNKSDTDKNWDIDQWKITIPASKDDWYGSGGTSAAELEPAHCHSSKDTLSNDSRLWFSPAGISFFDVSDGRMHFRADMGYGTTTENSNYIRSELRELFNAQALNTCSTSRDNTSWKIHDKATGTTKHTLISTLNVEGYPDIQGQDPKVIVGQVHGWKIKQALVKVQWEGDNKPVRVILNQDFYKDNQSCSSGTPDYPQCQYWPFSVNMGTYASGEDWQYTISIDEGGIRLITQSEDGSNRVSHYLEWGKLYFDTNNGTVEMSKNWADDDVAYYFKAGIYPQFRPDKAYKGNVFDVSFKDVMISHY